MMTQWKQTHNDVAQDEGTEVTLTAFDGICYNCQQKGHQAKECLQERKNGNNNNNRGGRGGRGYKGRRNGGRGGQQNYRKACRNCGKIGHMERNCWELKENQHKRPNGYRTSNNNNHNLNEQVNVARDNGPNIEYMLMAQDIEEEIWFKAEQEINDDSYLELLLGAMEFPTTQRWLENPNVWVGDTGATVNMSPHSQGMVNMKAAKSSDTVTMGNGQSESALQIGDIPGKLCDNSKPQQESEMYYTCQLHNTTYLASRSYNRMVGHWAETRTAFG
jgi:hypothetical protein